MTALQNAAILFSKRKCAQQIIAKNANEANCTFKNNLGSWSATAQKIFEEQKRVKRALLNEYLAL